MTRQRHGGWGSPRSSTAPPRPVNSARFAFLDATAPALYLDWDAVAGQNVATLRAEVGCSPHDEALSNLIGELSTLGDTFRERWAQHDVRRSSSTS